MAGFFKSLLKISMIALVAPGIAFAVQQQNPRGANNVRDNARSADAASNASIRRSATSVIARSAAQNSRQSRAVVTARPASVRAASVRATRPVVSGASVSRTASKPASVRSASVKKTGGNAKVSRAASARATAVFNDITKIGGGYANCRDAYATCMDQLCANANDTYRRCFCSDRFTEFRDTADRLDEALKLLADFQDNNLNAVDKSAAEVNAMYTATAGEKAIKRDTSASQKLLNSIGDVLSGKKTPTKNQTLSLGVLDFSGFGSNDDIFGATSDLFGGSSYTDVSSLEGKELYDNAMKQCSEITRESCNSDAMFNLARSSYSIMITQDCNAYEKNINAKKASVEETVRTAEKYLREARLEDYRSHNSADVNECLSKVESAMRQSTACGPNYEKCMDYTGKYINSTTGEPIYSQALFGLNNLIVLGDTDDVLGGDNAPFNKWLDDRRMFAESALDSCRDISENVWYEFKRSAVIQIAQAQDEKIQQIKDSCVATVKQCYDKQTGDLKSIDDTELQGTGAIAAVTARGMCYDRVQACAALYGDPDGCTYDDKTKKLTTVAGKKCGLQSLLTFVDTVDSVKVAEGCESVLRKYVAEICPKEEKDGEEIKYGGVCLTSSKNELRAALDNRMQVFCAQDLVNSDDSATIKEGTSAFNTNIMNQIIKEIYDDLGLAFATGCEEIDPNSPDNKDSKKPKAGGEWRYASEQVGYPEPEQLYSYFYEKYYGTKIRTSAQMAELHLEEKGYCFKVEPDVEIVPQTEIGAMCLAAGGTMLPVDETDVSKQYCKLNLAWYETACKKALKGEWFSSSQECSFEFRPHEM